MERDKFLILRKKGNLEAERLANDIGTWLAERHLAHAVYEAHPDIRLPLGDAAMLIVLGGDGTILGAARQTAGKNIAIFGINFGRVGFLTAASPEDWKEELSLALAGKLNIVHCSAIQWRLLRQNGEIARGIAINDIVVGRGNLARLVEINVRVNNRELGNARCDGLIIATSTGSSGYGSSAGGPVLYPGMPALCLVAICPFLAELAPLVLPVQTDFALELLPYIQDGFLTVDGQNGFSLKGGDRILARGWRDAAGFYGNENMFLDKLRQRGFLTDFPSPPDNAQK